MRDLVYYVAVTIDGFIADRSGRFDAFLVEGDHEQVVFGEYADALPGHVHEARGTRPPGTRFDTVIMGWNTLAPALSVGIGSPYPHLRQIAASRRMREVDPAVAVTGDPLGTVRRLKEDDGEDIWLCGGGELAGSLLPAIDRLVLKRNPFVLGHGIPLFGGAAPGAHTFTPTEVRTYESGVIVEEYVATR